MAIRLDDDAQRQLIESIKRFFFEELGDDIGDLKAELVLDFAIREIGPSVYNQAIADAQSSLERAVADLSGVRYEAEFDYWKKR